MDSLWHSSDILIIKTFSILSCCLPIDILVVSCFALFVVLILFLRASSCTISFQLVLPRNRLILSAVLVFNCFSIPILLCRTCDAEAEEDGTCDAEED